MTGKFVVNISTEVKGSTLPRGLVVEVRRNAAGRLEAVNVDGYTWSVTKAQVARNFLHHSYVDNMASEVAK